MAKSTRKLKWVGSTRVESHDGNVWTWTLAGRLFRWCQLGHLEHIAGDRVIRVGWYKDIAGAVGYSLGWTDRDGMSRNGQTPEY